MDDFALSWMRAIAEADPCYVDSEWGATCFFCGAMNAGRYPEQRFDHKYACEWMIAREHLGIAVTAEHQYERLGPPPPPMHGPWDPRREHLSIADLLPPLNTPRGGIMFIQPPKLT